MDIGERLTTTRIKLVTAASFRTCPGWRDTRPHQPLKIYLNALMYTCKLTLLILIFRDYFGIFGDTKF